MILVTGRDSAEWSHRQELMVLIRTSSQNFYCLIRKITDKEYQQKDTRFQGEVYFLQLEKAHTFVLSKKGVGLQSILLDTWASEKKRNGRTFAFFRQSLAYTDIYARQSKRQRKNHSGWWLTRPYKGKTQAEGIDEAIPSVIEGQWVGKQGRVGIAIWKD